MPAMKLRPDKKAGNSLWKDARRRLLRNRAAVVSLVFLVFMAAFPLHCQPERHESG